MTKIRKSIESALKKEYDAIIIGGGYYGVMLAYEAARRGIKTLLLEKNDFGSATSFNSLRIIHGGLRYLQSLDLHRFKESVAERKWFLKNFPKLTEPIACIMPLYNKGVKRTSILKIALKLNDTLSFSRNKNVNNENRINSGKVVPANEVRKLFPDIYLNGLAGGALWYDGSIPDSQIVLMEILKTSANNGCTPINYMEVKDILKNGDKISGVVALDSESGNEYKFKSNIVINATGPWSRTLAQYFHKDFKNLFKYSIATNVLFDRKQLSSYALAVTPPKKDARTYFIRPWKGKFLAGTIHEPWNKLSEFPMPTEKSLSDFIDDLNLSLPNLNLKRSEILQIYSGLLPAKYEGDDELAVREVIINHKKYGGPDGLYSLSGVKLTTSRLVAEKVLSAIFDKNIINSVKKLTFPVSSDLEYGRFDFDWNPEKDKRNWQDVLKYKIENEYVVHLSDLLLRRTTIGDNPGNALNVAREICKLFEWNSEEELAEIEKLKDYYKKRGYQKLINKEGKV